MDNQKHRKLNEGKKKTNKKKPHTHKHTRDNLKDGENTDPNNISCVWGRGVHPVLANDKNSQ